MIDSCCRALAAASRVAATLRQFRVCGGVGVSSSTISLSVVGEENRLSYAFLGWSMIVAGNLSQFVARMNSNHRNEHSDPHLLPILCERTVCKSFPQIRKFDASAFYLIDSSPLKLSWNRALKFNHFFLP